MRIGVLGGSFDPPHIGHLWIAEAALESLELDEIRWIPAAISPLKPNGPTATAEQRLQMLRLAVSGCPDYEVDDRELQRGRVSYTTDTLDELKAELPQSELFLIMGSDSLATIRQWHEPAKLLRLATLAVVQRGGDETSDLGVLDGLAEHDALKAIEDARIPMPLIELSSREIRKRVEQNRSIRFRTTRSVEAYIQAERIYSERSSADIQSTKKLD
ncbi:MAG: nicotinate (nicotinamide) nucleotide adenylyltransferase [Rubripirellula sp.]